MPKMLRFEGFRSLASFLAPAGVFALFVQIHTDAAASTKIDPKAEHATRVVIQKNAHTMDLFDGEKPIAHFSVAIGPGGAGVKHREGDNVTPVGHYHIVSRSPSRYHVFMRLDYPNADDRARFAKAVAAGNLPKGAAIGGDIGIHGAPPQVEWKNVHKDYDWTAGCIAVDDDEIERVAALVPDGTAVDIED